MNAPAIIQAARMPQTQCVYMLTDGARVKIGTTGNLTQRIASLSGACGVKLEVLRVIDHAGPRVERWLHRRFSALRGHGEWFSFSEEMLTIQPPEEARSIPVAIQRRDVRITVQERMREADKAADFIGVTARERLMILAQQVNDEEAEALCEAIRQFAAGKPGVAATPTRPLSSRKDAVA